MTHGFVRAGRRSGLPGLAALLTTFLVAASLLTTPPPAGAKKLTVRRLPAAWEELRGAGSDAGTVPISRASSWREMKARLPKSALHSHLQLGKPAPSIFQRRAVKERLAGLRGTGAPDTLVVRVAILRVDFNTDRKGSQTTGDGHFQVDNPDSLFIDPPPHDDRYFRAQLEAVNRYWSSMTWGHVRLEGDVYPRNQRFGAYHLSDMADYGPTSPDEFFSIEGLTKYSRESLLAADQDPDLDWKNYDVVFVAHAGADWQNDVFQDTPFDLPSFSITFSDSEVVVTDTADTLTTMMTFPESSSQDGFQVALNGVVAHEMGHQLGLLDIYNVETFAPTVAFYDVMDSGNMTSVFVPRPTPANPDSLAEIIGALPSAIGAWNRWQVTFPFGLDPPVVKEDLPRARLRAIQAQGPVPAGTQQWYRLPVSDTEYYLVENRVDDLDGKLADGSYNTALDQDDSTGVVLGPIVGNSDPAVISYNYDLLIDPGVLIWHIDERQALAFLSQGRGLNVDFDKRSVRIEEADGLVDIGSPFSPFPFGTDKEAFWAGNNANFTPTSRPSSVTDVGSPSGISIMNIGPRGFDVPMDFGFTSKPRGWPMTVGAYGTAGGTSATVGQVDGLDQIAALGQSSAFLFHYDDSNGDGEVDRPPGWPAAGVALRGAPAFTQTLGDLAGTGARQFVCVTDSGFVYALQGRGLPYGAVDSSGALLDFGLDAAPTWSAIPADLDGNGRDELYVVGRDARLRGYDVPATGPPVARFTPRFLLDAVADSGAVLVSTLAVGDLNGDGALDGLVAYVHKDSLCIQRFDAIGRRILRVSHPIPPEAHASVNERVWIGLADLDRKANVNDLEIVLALRSGWVVVLDREGQIQPGWPVMLDSVLGGPPAFGDIDGDGLLEIVLSGVGEVHALNYNGTEVTGWPARPRLFDYPGPPQPCGPAAIADVDGDGRLDVVAGFTDWTIRAIDPDGKVIPEFTMPMGNTPRSSPVILDANGDGRLDLFVQAGDGQVYGKILGGVASATNPAWPMFGGDASLHAAYDASRMPTARTGASSILAGRVTIYPNPVRGTDGEFRVRYTLGPDLDTATQVDVALYNVAGEKVRGAAGTTFSNTENVVTMSSRDLASGVYLCTLRVRSGSREQTAHDRVAVIR